MNKRLRFGIVGTGDHTKENLLPALRNVTGVELHTIQSRSSDRAQEIATSFDIPNISIATGADILKNSSCDAIVVSATPELHQEMILEAIRSKKHIFVEKPPAVDLGSFQKLQEAFQEATSAPVIQFGFNFRYSDFYRQLTATLGDRQPNYMKIKSYAAKPVTPMWNYEDVLSSSLYAVHIHAIEMLCYTLGTLIDLEYKITWPSKNKYVMTVLATFANGKLGTLELSNASNRFEFDVECIDSEENVFRCHDFNHMEAFGPNFDQGSFLPKSYMSHDISFLKGGFERTGYSNQFEFFRDSINSRKPDLRSIESCHDTYKIIDRITNDVR